MRVRPRVVLVIIAILSATSLVAIAWVGRKASSEVFTLIVLLLGFAYFGWNGVLLSEVSARVSADQVGDATDGVQFVFFGGVVFVRPAFGFLASQSGYQTASLSVAVRALVAAVIIGTSGPSHRHVTR